MSETLDEIEIMSVLEDIDSDNSEIEDNVIDFEKNNLDPDPDYDSHPIQEKYIKASHSYTTV